MKEEAEDCKRVRLAVGGENFYYIISDKLVQATVPRENDPTQTKVREAVEKTCEIFNEMLSKSPITGVMKPLTDNQIKILSERFGLDFDSTKTFARAVEALHSIGV